ncbi:MAG: mechanosensitive ion channel family protein [Anaerolineae bacterium]|nr:mechanosensitive ion channel family protein [Anaerolineae bacterium]
MNVELRNRVIAWLTAHGLRILLIAVVTALVLRLLRLLARQIPRWIRRRDEVEAGEWAQRAETLRVAVVGTVTVIILIVATLMILYELGLDIRPLLTSMGLVGLALSLGAQTLVRDVISGLFILIEGQFAIGDAIQTGSLSGTVERMTLRTTYLRGPEGELHIIPNGEIRTVSNLSRTWSRAVVDVPLPVEEDASRALEVLERVGQELAAAPQFSPLLLEAPVVTGIENLDGWTMRLRIMVKTLPGQHWEVMRELRRRVSEAFQREGIRLGFRPQEGVARM